MLVRTTIKLKRINAFKREQCAHEDLCAVDELDCVKTAPPPPAEFLGPHAPSSPSLSVENTQGPLLLLIYYVNDYIAHWLAIVLLMDLIKLGLITAGDI